MDVSGGRVKGKGVCVCRFVFVLSFVFVLFVCMCGFSCFVLCGVLAHCFACINSYE